MTFAQLLTNCYQKLDKNPGATPTATADRMKRFMNDRYREIMRMDGIGPGLRDETYTATCTAGNPRLVLPSVMTTISSVWDTTNRIKLRERPLADIRARDSGNAAAVTGVPLIYAVLNEAGIGAQPDTNPTLRIASSGADTRTFSIEAQLSGGQFTVHTGTLNGTTPVVLPAFVRVFRLQLQAAGTNDDRVVTISQTAPTAKTIVALAAGAFAAAPRVDQIAKHAWVLYLWPTPSAAITLSVDFSRPVYELIGDNDEPAFPEDFHELLVDGCCMDECLKMDDSRMAAFRARWDSGLRALRNYLHRSRGSRYIPGQSRPLTNTLGPYFPADWE